MRTRHESAGGHSRGRLAVAVCAALSLASPAAAQDVPIEARVAAISDGDTIEVERGGRTFTLEVAEIDCPEVEQPFGVEARRAAAHLAAGAQIQVGLRGVPSGGRMAGSVRLPDGRDLAGEMLRRGLAWWTGGAGGSAELRALEREARAARRGLWSLDAPEPPWRFRGEAGRRAERSEVEAVRAMPTPPREAPRRRGSCIPRDRCCRVCGKGKACGDSCIQASLTCHKGRGCACDGSEVCG